MSEQTGYLTQNFRLFHIKDQQEQSFPYHYHDFHKIVILRSGKVTYHVEGKAYRLKPWDLLLVSRHAIHMPEIDASLPYERFVLWIRNDLEHQELLRCFQKASDRSFSLIRLAPSIQEHLKDLLYQLTDSVSDSAFGSQLLREALFIQFMVNINRIFLDKQYIRDRKSYTEDSEIEKVLRYINRNLTEDLSIDALSGRFFLSKYYLMRKFKAATGYTLHNYIVNKRLLMARNLIFKGTPILKAAQQSGFADYTTFSRAYKKEFHEAPSSLQNFEPTAEFTD